jgi:hypothetical protein
MLFDKVHKLLEGIPDQMEKDIEEFNRNQKGIRDRIDEVKREMIERSKRCLLRK